MQLNAERLPRVYPSETEDAIEIAYTNENRPRRYSWSWNIPLLLASIVTVLVGGSALAGAYLWQSSRLSEEMLRRAAIAEESEDYRDQVKWLTRYVRLTPNDTEALIRLGIATDNAVETHVDLQNARIRLSKAIAATGELSAFKPERAELRRRLIKRLLVLGGLWSVEAQRQIIFLSPPPEDAEALSWLAKAMAGQRMAKVNGRSTEGKFNKEQDYWKWLAVQPVGQVLRTALQRNPQDLELASFFLSAVLETPEWFEGEGAPSEEALRNEAEELCASLAAMQESGRAQWLAYSYKGKQDAETAGPLLEAALPGALARLTENLQVAQEASASKESRSKDSSPEVHLADPRLIPLAKEDAYQPYWDWELAASAAAHASAQSRAEEAQGVYEQLLALASPAVPRFQREAMYLAAGQAYWAGKKPTRAIEIWTAGKETLNGSVELGGALLTGLTELGRTDDAQKTLQELEAYIKQQLSLLDGVQGTQLGPVLKEEARRRLELARWQTHVFNGNLHMQRGDYRAASEQLAKAFSSPLNVETPNRIQCGRLLAECYGRLQLWDLAGQTLDQCVVMRPTDITLRRLAAEAWRLLGAPDRAASQVDALDDGSFAAALEIARLKAAAQTSMPPEQRDNDQVRQALKVARLRWDAMPESERVSQPVWLLDVLEIAFAERESANLEAAQAALEEVAAKYATNPEVQLVAVANLARQGRTDSAKLAQQRLQKIAEVTGKPEDATNAIIAEIAIAEATGDIDGALRVARERIIASSRDGLRIAKVAAAYASAHKKNAAAYEILKLVPEESWDTDALMMAARLGMLNESSAGANIGEPDMQRWEDRLRKLEGEEGCNWRYLAAQRLIRDLAHSSNRAETLDKAEQYFNDIDRIRPRWGMGAALGGQIASLRGDRETAVALLRRAIQDGDTQASTVLLLVTELTALAQFDQAEQELKRLAHVPESILPTSMWEVALAQKRGDLRAALDAARKATSRNHKDANPWLVASQTALAVARSKDTSPDERAKLQAEAWDALEHAATITGGKDINVWNARFRFHVELGNKQQAKQELQALQSSPLPRSVGILAAANGYLLLQDFETAQARVKEAIALDPKDARPHVVMARILERMGDRPGMLSELQIAHRLDSDNADTRERLAVAYVLASEEVPWSEVDSLLSQSTDPSSAKSPLLGAMLSLERGDQQRIKDAMATLSSIANSSDAQATTAKRVLAKQYAKQFLKASPEERSSADGRRNLQQAQSLYEQLLTLDPPAPADGVSFATLLIEAGQVDEAQQIADRLSAAGTSPLVLQLRLRIAKLQGEDISRVASSWIASASGFEEEQLWEVVGKAMYQLDLNEEALLWLEKAYTQDPARFASYAVGLAKAGQTEKAVDLCVSLIEKDGNLQAATLLPEIVLLNPTEQQSEAVEQALAVAIMNHADSAPLLEAVATLRLMQERFTESVVLYEQADRLAPNRPRTLNNLAIALIELPGRETAALEKINKAIRLYGKHPQFLDTLAMVQSKLGQHEKAKVTLEEALELQKDPRFQLRLVEELIALGNASEAKIAWAQIETEQLKTMALTAAEQRSFNKLSQELGNN